MPESMQIPAEVHEGNFPVIEELEMPSWMQHEISDTNDPYVVILYNDDVNSQDEVVFQLQKATGYDLLRCCHIMFEAHITGRTIAYTGSMEDCERAARILRQIRLQVETDSF